MDNCLCIHCYTIFPLTQISADNNKTPQLLKSQTTELIRKYSVDVHVSSYRRCCSIPPSSPPRLPSMPPPQSSLGLVYKRNWGMYVCNYVRNHFKDNQLIEASQTPLTLHILKAYDEIYSKRGTRIKMQRHRQTHRKTLHVLYF